MLAARLPALIHLDLLLVPHRSLSPLGFRALMLVLGGLSFALGSVFLSLGAWPVVGFLGLDVGLVYLAFRANYASARAYERLRLTDDALIVERCLPSGRADSYSLQPYWLKVDLESPPGRTTRLKLSTHGSSLVIGAFLSPDERREVAERLRAALSRWRNLPPLEEHPA